MVDPVAAGSAYGVSLLAASSYDFLKGIYTNHKIKKKVESAADEVAESYDLIINGYNPLLITLESDHTEKIIENFKNENDDISIEDLANSLDKTLEDEFDVNPETLDFDLDSLIVEYLKTFEMEIIVHDKIRSKIFLQYFQILTENQIPAAKEYITELEQRSRRFYEQLNRFSSEVDRLEDHINDFDSDLGKFNNEIDRLSETIDQIEALEGQNDIDKDELRRLEQRLQDLKSISEEDIQEIIQNVEIDQEIQPIFTNILVSVLQLDIAEANQEVDELEEMFRDISSLAFIRIGAEIQNGILNIDVQNHRNHPVLLHFLIESAKGELVKNQKQLKNISVPEGIEWRHGMTADPDLHPGMAFGEENLSIDLNLDSRQSPIDDPIIIKIFSSRRKLDQSEELPADREVLGEIQLRQRNSWRNTID